jgi:hypothetical protein
MRPGDPIVIATPRARLLYRTQWLKVVQPNDLSVVDPTPNAVLTLTTCNPRYSACDLASSRARTWSQSITPTQRRRTPRPTAPPTSVTVGHVVADLGPDRLPIGRWCPRGRFGGRGPAASVVVAGRLRSGPPCPWPGSSFSSLVTLLPAGF